MGGHKQKLSLAYSSLFILFCKGVKIKLIELTAPVNWLFPIKEDVGNQLNNALTALEEANPELDGVLKHIDVLLRKMAKKRT